MLNSPHSLTDTYEAITQERKQIYLHIYSLSFHTPVHSLRSSNTNLLTVLFACTALMLVASLLHLLKSGTCCLQLRTFATDPTLLPAPQDSLLSASLFILLGTSLLAPQIWHLLTLCMFINFVYLLTYK